MMSSSDNEIGGLQNDVLNAVSADDSSYLKLIEEIKNGAKGAESFQSKKAYQPPAVSTSTLGTWEKHTKGRSSVCY